MLMLIGTDFVDFCHKGISSINQHALSIGKTAYVSMVDMALGFWIPNMYTGEMEND